MITCLKVRPSGSSPVIYNAPLLPVTLIHVLSVSLSLPWPVRLVSCSVSIQESSGFLFFGRDEARTLMSDSFSLVKFKTRKQKWKGTGIGGRKYGFYNEMLTCSLIPLLLVNYICIHCPIKRYALCYPQAVYISRQLFFCSISGRWERNIGLPDTWCLFVCLFVKKIFFM